MAEEVIEAEIVIAAILLVRWRTNVGQSYCCYCEHSGHIIVTADKLQCHPDD